MSPLLSLPAENFIRDEIDPDQQGPNGRNGQNGPQGGPSETIGNIFWPSPKTSPWLHPDKRPAMSGKRALVTTGVLLLCLLLPVYDLSEFLQIAALLGAGLFLCLNARTVGNMVMVLLPSLVLSGLTASFWPAALFVAAVGGCVAAALLFSHKRMYLLLPPVAAAFVVSYLLTDDLCLSLIVLLPVLAGIALGFATMSYKTRISAICLTSFALLFALLAPFLFAIKAEAAAESLTLTEGLLRFVDTIRGALRTAFDDFNVLTEKTMGFIPYTVETIEVLIATLIGLIPAFLIILTNLLAFIAQSTTIAICRSWGSEIYVTFPAGQFRMSLLSALVFMFCYIASLFSSGDPTTVFYLVTRNLCLILEPGLFLIGIGNALMRMLFGGKRPSMLLVFASVGLLLFAPTFLFTFVAFLGSYYLLLHSLRAQIPREHE